jgi:hypothetical protein
MVTTTNATFLTVALYLLDLALKVAACGTTADASCRTSLPVAVP